MKTQKIPSKPLLSVAYEPGIVHTDQGSHRGHRDKLGSFFRVSTCIFSHFFTAGSSLQGFAWAMRMNEWMGFLITWNYTLYPGPQQGVIRTWSTPPPLCMVLSASCLLHQASFPKYLKSKIKQLCVLVATTWNFFSPLLLTICLFLFLSNLWASSSDLPVHLQPWTCPHFWSSDLGLHSRAI